MSLRRVYKHMLKCVGFVTPFVLIFGGSGQQYLWRYLHSNQWNQLTNDCMKPANCFRQPCCEMSTVVTETTEIRDYREKQLPRLSAPGYWYCNISQYITCQYHNVSSCNAAELFCSLADVPGVYVLHNNQSQLPPRLLAYVIIPVFSKK